MATTQSCVAHAVTAVDSDRPRGRFGQQRTVPQLVAGRSDRAWVSRDRRTGRFGGRCFEAPTRRGLGGGACGVAVSRFGGGTSRPSGSASVGGCKPVRRGSSGHRFGGGVFGPRARIGSSDDIVHSDGFAGGFPSTGVASAAPTRWPSPRLAVRRRLDRVVHSGNGGPEGGLGHRAAPRGCRRHLPGCGHGHHDSVALDRHVRPLAVGGVGGKRGARQRAVRTPSRVALGPGGAPKSAVARQSGRRRSRGGVRTSRRQRPW